MPIRFTGFQLFNKSITPGDNSLLSQQIDNVTTIDIAAIWVRITVTVVKYFFSSSLPRCGDIEVIPFKIRAEAEGYLIAGFFGFYHFAKADGSSLIVFHHNIKM
jgi:hypothetical protein